MGTDIFYLLLGLVGLYFGAEWLVGGSSGLARRMGVAPLVIGLTVVAFGTSAPELSVSMQLNFAGSPDAAVGNIVGSNICNILLILGFAALIRPLGIPRQVVRREMPILIGVSLLLIAMLYDGRLQRWEGAVLVVGIIVFIVVSFRFAPKDEPALEEDSSAVARSPLFLIGMILGGLLILIAGAKFFQMGGVGIAKRAGVSDAVIGLTLLAFGTSLPELATSIVACLKRQGDIIAGNAVGSSVFNVLAILGITVLVKPMLVSQIELTDLLVMLISVIAVIPLMITGKRLSRIEGGIMLAVYVAYVIHVAGRGA